MVEFFPCNFRGCVSLSLSAIPHCNIGPAPARWLPGPEAPALQSQVQLPPGPLAASITQRHQAWVSGPAGSVLFVLCWGRGVHTVAEHSRPEPSPEMIQRPDVFEDFKEGPAVLGGQSGLVSWVAVGRLGLHPQSWALPLPGPFPQLYDKGTPPFPLTKARTVTNSELPPSDLPQDSRKLVFLNTESILLKVTQLTYFTILFAHH